MKKFAFCPFISLLFWCLAVLFLWIKSYNPHSAEAVNYYCVHMTILLSLLYVWLSLFLIFRAPRCASTCWALACAAYLIHVACAFAYSHHWSHRQAYLHVQRATNFGSGIFVTYFFSLLWLIDALWFLLAMKNYVHRPTWLARSIRCFLYFIILNGAVIFEGGLSRWGTIIGSVVLLIDRLWVQHYTIQSKAQHVGKINQP